MTGLKVECENQGEVVGAKPSAFTLDVTLANMRSIIWSMKLLAGWNEKHWWSVALVLQENTKAKFESVRQELCGDDCKLEIFQEENSDEIIVSGKYVEGQ